MSRLADDLERLCYAETEGKFFNCVTDNIAEIIAALRLAATTKAGVWSAVEPFIEALDGCIDDDAKDSSDIWESSAAMCITVGNLRDLKKAYLSLFVGEQEIVQEEAHATRQSPSRAEDSATETGIPQIIIRKNEGPDDGGTIDEVIASNCTVHIEQMDKHSFWLNIAAPTGYATFCIGSRSNKAFVNMTLTDEHTHEVAETPSRSATHSNEQSAQGLSRATGGDA